jgi:hypothetical protein
MIHEFLAQTSSRHLFWKEYRAQRTLWFAVLAMAGGYGLLLLAWGALMSTGSDVSPGTVFFTMLAFPPVYAWACAALLFAGEHEEETYEFLRSQPIVGGQVYSVKLLTILAGTLLLVPAVLLLGLLLTGGRIDGSPVIGRIELDGYHWVNVWVTSLEMLAWSVFFSLWLRKMLPALLLSAGLALLMGFIAVSLADLSRSAHLFLDVARLSVISQAFRIFVALCVLGITAKWGRYWLGWRFLESGAWSREQRVANSESRRRLIPFRLHLERMGYRQLAHLTWHAWRQSASLYFATLAFAILACSLLALRWAVSRQTSPPNSMIAFWYALVPLAGWAGLLSFMPDQIARRASYFSERPVHPGHLWLSRLLVAASLPLGWLLVVSLLTVVSLLWGAAPSFGLPAGSQLVSLPYFESLARDVDVDAILWLTLLLFAVGQLVSLFSRSVVVGITVGIASLMGFGVAFGLTHALGVPGGLVALPLFIAFLLATRRSMRAWTEEVSVRTDRLRKGAWIAGPVVLVLCLTASYRVLEVPRVTESSLSQSSPLHVEQLRRPPTREEVVTAKIYVGIFRHFRGLPEMGSLGPLHSPGAMDGMGSMEEWSLPEPLGPSEVRTDREVLREFIEATRRPTWFPPRHGTRGTTGLTSAELEHLREVPLVVGPLTTTVATRIYQLLENGELEQAMEYPLALIRFSRQLMPHADLTGNFTARSLESRGLDLLTHWASWEGQSEELVRRALRQMDEEFGRSHGDSDGLEEEYDFTEGMEVAVRDARWDFEQHVSAMRREWLWISDVVSERPAYVDNVDTRDAAMLKSLRWMRRYTPWEVARIERIFDVALAGVDERELGHGLTRWILTTPFLTQNTGMWHHRHATFDFRERQDQLVIHRLQLALRIYQLEHGRYPETLTELPEDDQKGIPESMFSWEFLDSTRRSPISLKESIVP